MFLVKLILLFQGDIQRDGVDVSVENLSFLLLMQARLVHPDKNPNDPEAANNFQVLTERWHKQADCSCMRIAKFVDCIKIKD